MSRAAWICAVALVASLLAISAPPDPPPEPHPAGPFFVNTLGSSHLYTLGRYIDRNPAPVGSVLKSACHLWSPSVTRAGELFWLYAAESGPEPKGGPPRSGDCSRWLRVVAFTSRDGRNFRRRASAIRPRASEGELRMPYVVFDHGIFRAWFTVDHGGEQGQALFYAESKDGLRFKRRGRRRARAGPGRLDAGAITVDTVFRDPKSGRWSLLYTGFDATLERARPMLMTFKHPRQRRYRKRGPIAEPRSRGGTLLAPASRGDREIAVSGGPFEPGDPVVVASDVGAQADPSQVLSQTGVRVALQSPLHLDHGRGGAVALGDAAKVSPSYVCRTAGGWRGLFTVFGAIPRVTGEFTAIFRAARLSGPWRLDRGAPFPFLSPRNAEFKSSVENPTPVTRGPAPPRCRGRLRP